MKHLKVLILLVLTYLSVNSVAHAMPRIGYFTVHPSYLDGGAIKINKSSTAEIKTEFKVDITFQRDFFGGAWESVDLYADVCAFLPKMNGEIDAVVFQTTPIIRIKSSDFSVVTPGVLVKTYTVTVIANAHLLNVATFERIGVFYKNGGKPQLRVENLLNTSAGIYRIKYIDVTGATTNPPNNPTPSPLTTRPTSTTTSYAILPDVRTEAASITENAGISWETPSNTVMTGRRHEGDEHGQTQYEYATLKAVDRFGDPVAGTITVDSRVWSGYMENSNSQFAAPEGYIITGREHWGDENGNTRAQFGLVRFNGNPTTVKTPAYSQDFVSVEESSGNWYKTDPNSFVSFLYHWGDENGMSKYKQGQISYKFSVPEPGAPTVAGTSALYAYYNSATKDFWYSATYFPDGADNGDWRYQDILCYVATALLPSIGMNAAYYSFYNANIQDHFYGGYASSIGGGLWTLESPTVLFYAGTSSMSGLVPIYSYVSSNNKHALSKDVGVSADLTTGVTYYREAVLFYAYP